MKLFGAARRLLNEVTVFDRHPNLMAQREQEAKLGCGKRAAVGRAEEQHAESLFLGLQTDSYNRAQTLAHGKLPETPEGFFSLERSPGGIAAQIAKYNQAAQSGNQVHQMIVQTLFLRGGTKIFRKSDGDDRSGPLGIAVMQEQRSRRHTHNAQNALEGVRQHLLNFGANETGSRQIHI